MAHTILLGDPAFFRVKSGSNPHTRDAWGRRKRVDRDRAGRQWARLRSLLEEQGAQVRVIPGDPENPGLVFPANAGFRFGSCFYLSNLNPARAGEKEHYRRFLQELGLKVLDFPAPHRFEGEADFIPVGAPPGGSPVYLFTYGRIETPRWRARWGLPPYRRIYGFRSDERVKPVLRQIVRPIEVIPLELADEAHYHGDTVICPFGPRLEFLLVYLEGFTPWAQRMLRSRFQERLVVLSPEDGRAFAANSFQIRVCRDGQEFRVLLTPDGLTQECYDSVRRRGVIPCPVDVSEFLGKGGGALKCMLLNLG